MFRMNCYTWLLFGFLLLGWTQNEKSDSVQPEVSERVNEPVAPWRTLYDSLRLREKGLSEKAFELSWNGFNMLKFNRPYLAIADFSQSSGNKRLYVLDMEKKEVIMQTLVAHGRNSGFDCASEFSNREGSFQSSLGFYKTLGTYEGKHGVSLRLEGLEAGINDQAFRRAIVIHGADYVSESFVRQHGRLGRSHGCPAVPREDEKKLIALLGEGSGLFIYSDTNRYLKESSLLTKLEI
jgi:hypothetical protein